MSWSRTSRIEAQLKEKIAVVVLERLGDPRLGFITITGVRLTADKKLCRVFYTVLGTDAQVKLTTRALVDAAPNVQERIAPSLRMRSVPKLLFVFDESIEKESRMNAILDQIAEERDDAPKAAPAESEPAPSDEDDSA